MPDLGAAEAVIGDLDMQQIPIPAHAHLNGRCRCVFQGIGDGFGADEIHRRRQPIGYLGCLNVDVNCDIVIAEAGECGGQFPDSQGIRPQAGGQRSEFDLECYQAALAPADGSCNGRLGRVTCLVEQRAQLDEGRSGAEFELAGQRGSFFVGRGQEARPGCVQGRCLLTQAGAKLRVARGDPCGGFNGVAQTRLIDDLGLARELCHGPPIHANGNDRS